MAEGSRWESRNEKYELANIDEGCRAVRILGGYSCTRMFRWGGLGNGIDVRWPYLWTLSIPWLGIGRHRSRRTAVTEEEVGDGLLDNIYRGGGWVEVLMYIEGDG